MLPLPAGREASSGVGAPVYTRHRPERTLLYQIVKEYYPDFVAHLATQGRALPEYVQREFEDYIRCGCLEHGFLRVRCDTCNQSLQRSLDEFLLMWLNNLYEQGHKIG